VRLTERAGAATLNRHDRLRAITIGANLAPDYALGDALAYLEGIVRDDLQAQPGIAFKGQSREFREASGALAYAFGLSLLMVYLVLAALFESFTSPLIILLTVPLAAFGGLAGLHLAGETLNIYSQIALVMLIGLAVKNGILIVEFAGQLRDEGLDWRQAIVEASLLRLRPILMTGLSTSLGAVPLVVTSGAGAEARSAIGVVVLAGVTFATLTTLVVVPGCYGLLARFTGSPSRRSRELERQLADAGAGAGVGVGAGAGIGAGAGAGIGAGASA
jgi:multidrug efflux pump